MKARRIAEDNWSMNLSVVVATIALIPLYLLLVQLFLLMKKKLRPFRRTNVVSPYDAVTYRNSPVIVSSTAMVKGDAEDFKYVEKENIRNKSEPMFPQIIWPSNPKHEKPSKIFAETYKSLKMGRELSFVSKKTNTSLKQLSLQPDMDPLKSTKTLAEESTTATIVETPLLPSKSKQQSSHMKLKGIDMKNKPKETIFKTKIPSQALLKRLQSLRSLNSEGTTNQDVEPEIFGVDRNRSQTVNPGINTIENSESNEIETAKISSTPTRSKKTLTTKKSSTYATLPDLMLTKVTYTKQTKEQVSPARTVSNKQVLEVTTAERINQLKSLEKPPTTHVALNHTISEQILTNNGINTRNRIPERSSVPNLKVITEPKTSILRYPAKPTALPQLHSAGSPTSANYKSSENPTRTAESLTLVSDIKPELMNPIAISKTRTSEAISIDRSLSTSVISSSNSYAQSSSIVLHEPKQNQYLYNRTTVETFTENKKPEYSQTILLGAVSLKASPLSTQTEEIQKTEAIETEPIHTLDQSQNPIITITTRKGVNTVAADKKVNQVERYLPLASAKTEVATNTIKEQTIVPDTESDTKSSFELDDTLVGGQAFDPQPKISFPIHATTSADLTSSLAKEVDEIIHLFAVSTAQSIATTGEVGTIGNDDSSQAGTSSSSILSTEILVQSIREDKARLPGIHTKIQLTRSDDFEIKSPSTGSTRPPKRKPSESNFKNVYEYGKQIRSKIPEDELDTSQDNRGISITGTTSDHPVTGKGSGPNAKPEVSSPAILTTQISASPSTPMPEKNLKTPKITAEVFSYTHPAQTSAAEVPVSHQQSSEEIATGTSIHSSSLPVLVGTVPLSNVDKNNKKKFSPQMTGRFATAVTSTPIDITGTNKLRLDETQPTKISKQDQLKLESTQLQNQGSNTNHPFVVSQGTDSDPIKQNAEIKKPELDPKPQYESPKEEEIKATLVSKKMSLPLVPGNLNRILTTTVPAQTENLEDIKISKQNQSSSTQLQNEGINTNHPLIVSKGTDPEAVKPTAEIKNPELESKPPYKSLKEEEIKTSLVSKQMQLPLVHGNLNDIQTNTVPDQTDKPEDTKISKQNQSSSTKLQNEGTNTNQPLILSQGTDADPLKPIPEIKNTELKSKPQYEYSKQEEIKTINLVSQEMLLQLQSGRSQDIQIIAVQQKREKPDNASPKSENNEPQVTEKSFYQLHIHDELRVVNLDNSNQLLVHLQSDHLIQELPENLKLDTETPVENSHFLPPTSTHSEVSLSNSGARDSMLLLLTDPTEIYKAPILQLNESNHAVDEKPGPSATKHTSLIALNHRFDYFANAASAPILRLQEDGTENPKVSLGLNDKALLASTKIPHKITSLTNLPKVEALSQSTQFSPINSPNRQTVLNETQNDSSVHLHTSRSLSATTVVNPNLPNQIAEDRDKIKSCLIEDQAKIAAKVARLKWLQDEEDLFLDRASGALAYFALDSATLQLLLNKDVKMYTSDNECCDTQSTSSANPRKKKQAGTHNNSTPPPKKF